MVTMAVLGYVAIAFLFDTLAKAYEKRVKASGKELPFFEEGLVTFGVWLWPVALLLMAWSWSTRAISNAIVEAMDARAAAKLAKPPAEESDDRGSYR